MNKRLTIVKIVGFIAKNPGQWFFAHRFYSPAEFSLRPGNRYLWWRAAMQEKVTIYQYIGH